MKKAWTFVRGDGSSRTLEERGYENVTLRRISLGVDTLTFSCRTEDIDNVTNRLAAGESCALKWQEINITTGNLTGSVVQYFKGIVLANDPWCDQSEGVDYTIAGPWWHFENLTFQQSWRTYVGGVLTTVNKTRVRLCEDIDGNKLTIGAQIVEVLDWLVAAGAPFTFDRTEILTDFQFFTIIDEVVDMKCAECIKRLLRVVPDAVGWFDYSQETPIFRLKRYVGLTEATIAISESGEPVVEHVGLAPQHGVRVPAVVIKFEQTNQDGANINSTITQTTYPDDGLNLTTQAAEYAAKVAANEKLFGALVTTVSIEGYSASYTTQQVISEAIFSPYTTANAAQQSWWKDRLRWLNDPNLEILSMTNGTYARTGSDDPVGETFPALGYELQRGAVHDWMKLGDGTQVEAAEVTAQTRIKYRVKTGGSGSDKYTEPEERVVYWPMMATNATTGTYIQRQLVSTAETVPAGLAQVIYEVLNILYFEGPVNLDEVDCTGTYAIGQKINVSGGDPGWLAARAPIQSMVEQIDRGKTSLQCSPPPHLSVKDVIDWGRVFRVRRISTPYGKRGTGRSPMGGEIALGKKAPLRNWSQTAVGFKSLVIADASKIVNINPSDMTEDATLGLHKITLHIKQGNNCVRHTAWVLMSEPVPG